VLATGTDLARSIVRHLRGAAITEEFRLAAVQLRGLVDVIQLPRLKRGIEVNLPLTAEKARENVSGAHIYCERFRLARHFTFDF